MSNFKSFKNTEIKFDKFNVIIGSNASGKSNLIQAFKFMQDIYEYDLTNAIALQGGIEYFRNIKIGSAEETKFEIDITGTDADSLAFYYYSKILRKHPFLPKKCTYKFSIKTGKKTGFKVTEESLILEGEIIQKEKQSELFDKSESGLATIFISRQKGKLKSELTIGNKKFFEIIPNDPFYKGNMSKSLLMMGQKFGFRMIQPVSMFIADTKIFDIDPKLPKKAVQIKGKAELEPDGSNLSLILKSILGDRAAKRKFFNLMRELLPFVKEVNIEDLSDRSLLFNLKESYFDKGKFPASFISDGTINVTALITALFFDESIFTIIEEPERNIHPSLIAKVTNLMKEASNDKQILATTHNPQIVRFCELENIILVKREKSGYSEIVKPSESEEVKNFLKNEMELEDLFVDNLLEI